MKLAFCLFKYFPFGGMQRDFLRIAKECHARGHDIHVYTMSWEGEQEPGFTIHIINACGLQNHARIQSFISQLQPVLAEQSYDVIIGFNKMPGLDIYYAADVCYQKRAREKHSGWYRLLPRYRQLVALEEAVFKKGNRTDILAISPFTEQEFNACYGTESNRFHLLPPGIAPDRLAPDNAADIRAQVRARHQLKENQFLLLMVGSGFKTKGLDRSIRAIAALPPALKERCQLFVIGQDNAEMFKQQAKQANISDRVHFLGGRSDVPDFLLAADLLMHPAYHENTGTVLLEALAAGLPVLTVDVCGYAHYISEAKAGRVLTSPFNQMLFNKALADVLQSSDLTQWRVNGFTFAKHADIYSMPIKAVDLIEQRGMRQPFDFTAMMKLAGEQYRLQPGRQTWRVKVGDNYYFLKQHTGVGWREIFKNLFQGKKPVLGARNEQRALEKLKDLGVNVPQVVSFGEQGRNPARQQSYILLEELKPTISLEHLTADWRKSPPSFTLKMRLIREVAQMARVMHENGITHRDFYLCHFLLNKDSNKLYLIDLHRAEIHQQLPERWLLKDLAGLYFSSLHAGLTQRDYFRFIKYYRHMSLRNIFNTENDRWMKVKMRGEQLYREHN